MTQNEAPGAGNPGSSSHTDYDLGSGLPIPIDAGMTDLGDDATRNAVNDGSTLADRSPDGLAGEVDPRATDLGDDVYRSGSQG